MNRVTSLVMALLLVSGCGLLKKKTGDDAGVVATADTAAAVDQTPDAALAAASAASVKKANTAIGIPAHDDHQAKAAAEINKTNYKDELDKIEKANK